MRRLTTGDGGELLERLDAMDADGMSYSYTILESPLPVANYKSTIAVSDNGKGAVITWSSQFDGAGMSDEEAATVIEGIYDAGLASLKEQFGG